MAAPDARAGLLSAAALVFVLAVGPAAAAEQTAALAAGAKPEGATTQPEPHITLTAHRAVYDLTLLKAIGSKSPTNARGRIAFDFSGSACEGYVQNFRQLTELQPADGPTRLSDMRSATFEDGGGRSFDFKMQTTVDGGGPELVDGKARKAADGELSVSLTKPKASKFDADPDAIFPTEHLMRILAAAEAGRHILEVKVYDGSETGDKLYETTSVIGQPIATPASETPLHIPLLDGMRRWPVSISYFDAGKKDEAPNYILSFDLYENGISRGLRLDYGDFVLGGEMMSLELLPEKVCGK